MLMYSRHIRLGARVGHSVRKGFRNARRTNGNVFFFYPKHYRSYFIPILKYYNQTRIDVGSKKVHCCRREGISINKLMTHKNVRYIKITCYREITVNKELQRFHYTPMQVKIILFASIKPPAKK